MKLNEIASISGKGGLFHILKPTRGGVIVETLDEQKKKLVVGANNRVSLLTEVSIYTTGSEDSALLETVLHKIYEEFGEDLGVDSTSDPDELQAFLKHVLPEYDADRVYPSDMKKLVSWYKILYQYAPELLKKEEAEQETPANEEKLEKPKSEDAE